MCSYLGLKSEIFNFGQYFTVKFFTHFVLHNLGVLNSNRSDDILDLVPSTFKLAKQKNGRQNHIFSILGCP